MHSLRPHNHRWVHLTVKHWTTSPKRPRGFRVFFWSFTNGLFCRERCFWVDIESDRLVFSFGAKEQSIPWRFRLPNYSRTLCAPCDSLYLRHTLRLLPHPKATIDKPNKKIDPLFVQPIRTTHRRLKQFGRHIGDSYEGEHEIDATTTPKSTIATSSSQLKQTTEAIGNHESVH
jgi:hypothetical protein